MHPKLFVWVYQHVGKNLKSEIRCHAVLCERARDAKEIENLLNSRLQQTFLEYKREKRRQQNSRLCNSKNGGLLAGQVGTKKRAFTKSTKNYKPPVQHGMCSAPKLDDVLEEEEEEEEEQFDHEISIQASECNLNRNSNFYESDEDEIINEDSINNGTLKDILPNKEKNKQQRLIKNEDLKTNRQRFIKVKKHYNENYVHSVEQSVCESIELNNRLPLFSTSSSSLTSSESHRSTESLSSNLNVKNFLCI